MAGVEWVQELGIVRVAVKGCVHGNSVTARILVDMVAYQAHSQGRRCNGHYNRTPDLGKCVMWWNMWDLARYSILDA